MEKVKLNKEFIGFRNVAIICTKKQFLKLINLAYKNDYKFCNLKGVLCNSTTESLKSGGYILYLGKDKKMMYRSIKRPYGYFDYDNDEYRLKAERFFYSEVIR